MFLFFLQIHIYIVASKAIVVDAFILFLAIVLVRFNWNPPALSDAGLCARACAMLIYFEFHYYQNWKLNRQKSRQSAMCFARVSCSPSIHFLSEIIFASHFVSVSTSKYLESKGIFRITFHAFRYNFVSRQRTKEKDDDDEGDVEMRTRHRVTLNISNVTFVICTICLFIYHNHYR